MQNELIFLGCILLFGGAAYLYIALDKLDDESISKEKRILNFILGAVISALGLIVLAI